MRYLALVIALAVALVAGSVRAQNPVSVTVIADLDPNSATGIRIEGLVADQQGRLYTVDLDSARLYRITAGTGAVETLGTLPRPGSGMAFDRDGNLYMASQDVIVRIPAAQLAGATVDPAAVQTFATGVPGANGLAFDGSGNLYVSGGNTGTIYVVAPDGAARAFVSGLVSDRQEQQISTNGLQFGLDGRLYSANTGTGVIDRITLNPDGTPGVVERFASNALLLGADGIVFAADGNLYVAANERNAIVRVSPDGEVTDVTSNGNTGPLEFPASPAFVGTSLYASNFDIPRGANAPGDGGVGASIARIDVGEAGAPLPATVTFQATPVPTTDPATAGTATATPTPGGPTLTATLTPTAGIGLPTPELTPTPTISDPLIIGTPVVQTPVLPTVAPPAGGGLVRLPDTGAPSTVSWIVLAVVGMLLLVTGIVLARRRRVTG